MAYTKAKRDENAQLAEMRARFRRADEAHSTAFDNARDDIKFVTVPGNQWDPDLKLRRRNRPTYEFPKLRQHVQQVINEQKQTRPQGKVRGVEESDQGLAELMQGICRNIESTSNASRAYDIAYEKAVKGGYGVFRICTDYLNDDDFEQDIRIKPIRNPFAAKCDPAAVEIDRRDANFWFIEDTVKEEDWERLYPGTDLADFDLATKDWKDWRESGKVRVVEYWYKEPVKRDLWALSDGRVVFVDELAKESGLKPDEVAEFLAAAGISIVRQRKVDGHKVFMRLSNGARFLSEPYEFPSKFIPIIPVWGNIEDIDGEDYWSGMVRFGKDQQRLHNVHRTAMVEAVAKAPKAPFVTKPGWIKGYEAMWQGANAEDRPYLLINDNVPDAAMPRRTEQAQVPAALIQMAGMDNDDMKAATGIYDASLGARSNETSGVAINNRKMQGATATFNYLDNLVYAIQFCYEIMIDMIPRVYDTPRVVRVLGEDGGAKWRQLYQKVEDPETGQVIKLNDIRKGKYDVTVTVGPSYATQRMEAAEGFAQMAGQIGAAAPGIGPLLAYGTLKNTDAPGMEEIETALRKQLVAQGLLPPKDGEEPPAPPAPDPRAEAQARKLAADAAYTEAKAQNEQAMGPAELQKLVAETVQIQLANMLNMPMPPPDPGLMATPYEQPPQGGFFVPDDQSNGWPGPQFTG